MGRGDEILRLVNLNKTFVDKEGQKVVALDNISTTFKRGEFVAVVGRSGSGKSTLINILGGLDIPTGGNYFCEGNDVTRLNEDHWDALRNNKIGFIFQEYHLLDYLTVYENVEISLKYQDLDAQSKRAKIEEILTNVGLFEHRDKKSSDLSGGQRQRVAVARALVKEPDIILADEPTGALDVNTADEIISLLKGLSNDRLVIVVTHDRRIANLHANRIIEIGKGKFLTDLVKEEIESTYQNTYRKTKATNLSLEDKIAITKKKISQKLFRTLFTAITLALAFSFTIIFNGISRGFNQAYDNYYESLNKTNSFSFDLQSKVDDSPFQDTSEVTYTNAKNEILSAYDGIADIVPGYSRSVAKDGSDIVETVQATKQIDVLDEFKVRIFADEILGSGMYNFDQLFIGESSFPSLNNEVILTSKSVRDYYQVSDSVSNLSAYVGSSFTLPTYTYEEGPYLESSLDFFSNLYTGDSGVTYTYKDTPLVTDVPLAFNKINIPLYCYVNNADYNKDQVADEDLYFATKCKENFTIVENRTFFSTYDEYVTYLDEYFTQIQAIPDGGSISTADLETLVYNSESVYYLGTQSQLETDNIAEKVFTALDNDIDASALHVEYAPDKAFKKVDTSQAKENSYTVSAIIENEYESQVYFSKTGYNSLFENALTYSPYEAYFSVMMNKEIVDATPEAVAFEYLISPLNSLDSGKVNVNTFRVYTTDKIEVANNCSSYSIDSAVNPASDISLDVAGSVYHITDYGNCKFGSEAYASISTITLLFNIFFNVLMIVSIVFFNLLLKVILQERISEIGVYRSVGATSKDVKTLFFVEIFVIIFIAIILSIGLIFGINYFVNTMFTDLVNVDSRVISFAGIKLSLGESNQLTKLSLFNLLVYVFITLGLLLFLSNRNISKISDTKPIDILRDVD